MKLGAVTIDLDSARNYHAIHGLTPPSGDDVVVTRGLPRFLELCEKHHIKATLFTIGQDLGQPEVARLILQAHQAGHEIASHSNAHDYRLSRMTLTAIQADLNAAREAITSVTGVPPIGFRAPGYNLSPTLIRQVAATGHLYDSSIFPSWPYFVARATAIGVYKVEGHPSHSIVGDAREFTGPRTPFRPALHDHTRPASTGEADLGLWELPMAVLGPLAMPVIGTFLAMYPPVVSKAVSFLRTRVGGSLNLEFHAIDFVAAEDGLHPELVEKQADVRIPLPRRMAGFAHVMKQMRSRMDVAPLRDWLPVLNAPLTRGRLRG